MSERAGLKGRGLASGGWKLRRREGRGAGGGADRSLGPEKAGPVSGAGDEGAGLYGRARRKGRDLTPAWGPERAVRKGAGLSPDSAPGGAGAPGWEGAGVPCLCAEER